MVGIRTERLDHPNYELFQYSSPHCICFFVFLKFVCLLCFQRINCRYSIAQMCTREDTLSHYSGSLSLDGVMSHNKLTIVCFVFSTWESTIMILQFGSVTRVTKNLPGNFFSLFLMLGSSILVYQFCKHT